MKELNPKTIKVCKRFQEILSRTDVEVENCKLNRDFEITNAKCEAKQVSTLQKHPLLLLLSNKSGLGLTSLPKIPRENAPPSLQPQIQTRRFSSLQIRLEIKISLARVVALLMYMQVPSRNNSSRRIFGENLSSLRCFFLCCQRANSTKTCIGIYLSLFVLREYTKEADAFFESPGVSANAGKSTDSDEDANMMDEAESSADEALPVLRRRIRRADDVLPDDNMEVCLPVCVCVCVV